MAILKCLSGKEGGHLAFNIFTLRSVENGRYNFQVNRDQMMPE